MRYRKRRRGFRDAGTVGRCFLAIVLTTSLMFIGAKLQPAWAAFPGASGKIAFVSERGAGYSGIYVMNADGSGQTRLTNNPLTDRRPDWHPVPTGPEQGEYTVTEANVNKLSKTTLGRVRTPIVNFAPGTTPAGVAIDSAGNYIVVEQGPDVLSMVTPSGSRSIVFAFAEGTTAWGIATCTGRAPWSDNDLREMHTG